MNNQGLPPNFHKPKIKWRYDIYWSAIPFILSIITFIFPDIINKYIHLQNNLLLGAFLFFSPVYLPVVFFLIRLVLCSIQRSANYPRLYACAELAILNYDHLRNEYFDIITKLNEKNEVEIIKAGIDRGKIYVVFKKKKHRIIQNNEKIAIIHKEDGLLLGIFSISEIRTEEVYAKEYTNIDPVWFGYLMQKQETVITPNLAAYLVS